VAREGIGEEKNLTFTPLDHMLKVRMKLLEPMSGPTLLVPISKSIDYIYLYVYIYRYIDPPLPGFVVYEAKAVGESYFIPFSSNS
jgi:hypothetical protein